MNAPPARRNDSLVRRAPFVFLLLASCGAHGRLDGASPPRRSETADISVNITREGALSRLLSAEAFVDGRLVSGGVDGSQLPAPPPHVAVSLGIHSVDVRVRVQSQGPERDITFSSIERIEVTES